MILEGLGIVPSSIDTRASIQKDRRSLMSQILESRSFSAVAEQSEITPWERGRHRDAISFGAVMGVVDTYSCLRNMRLPRILLRQP